MQTRRFSKFSRTFKELVTICCAGLALFWIPASPAVILDASNLIPAGGLVVRDTAVVRIRSTNPFPPNPASVQPPSTNENLPPVGNPARLRSPEGLAYAPRHGGRDERMWLVGDEYRRLVERGYATQAEIPFYTVNVFDTVQYSLDPEGLAFDGTSLWIADDNDGGDAPGNFLYEISPGDFEVDANNTTATNMIFNRYNLSLNEQTRLDGGAEGLAWDPNLGVLWLSADNQIVPLSPYGAFVAGTNYNRNTGGDPEKITLDTSGLNVDGNRAGDTLDIEGLGFMDRWLLLGDRTGQEQILLFNTTTGKIDQIWKLPGENRDPAGLTYDGRFVYFTDNNGSNRGRIYSIVPVSVPDAIVTSAPGSVSFTFTSWVDPLETFIMSPGANDPSSLNPVYIDPEIAVAYEYSVEGPNSFRSLILPDIGDGLFDLYLFDGSDYIFEATLSALEEYFFGTTGIDRFLVTGIEASAMLELDDPLAFATGLTFFSATSSLESPVVVMTALAEVPGNLLTGPRTAVTEPASLLLLLLGLLAFSATGRMSPPVA